MPFHSKEYRIKYQSQNKIMFRENSKKYYHNHLATERMRCRKKYLFNRECLRLRSILMDDERYVLSNWERKNIFTRSKKSDLSKMVLDAIYNIRRILIEQKINSLISDVGIVEERDKIMESIVDYNNLKNRLFERLNRVV